eukprot:10957684-Heterocapsa_arctica.AAC.1
MKRSTSMRNENIQSWEKMTLIMINLRIRNLTDQKRIIQLRGTALLCKDQQMKSSKADVIRKKKRK